MSLSVPHQPLRLHPFDVPRLWGGVKFASSTSLPIGERWLYSLLQGQVSVVHGGIHDGKPLDATVFPFALPPLLVKLIDTASALSVQVHPDDAMAQRFGWPNGKSEMWYILSATPQSYILLGLKEDTPPERIAHAAHSGDLPHLLHRIHPQPGDCYHVPAGQIHALGPGLQLLEIQQAADITYRLYDWGRIDAHGRSRPLDLDHALEACSKVAYSPQQLGQDLLADRSLGRDSHFQVTLHHAAPSHHLILPSQHTAYILVGLQGDAHFIWPYDGASYHIQAEELLLLPPHAEQLALRTLPGFSCIAARAL